MERPAYDTPPLVNPPPPPQPLPPGPGYPITPTPLYASPGLRVVGGLIDVVIISALFGAVEGVTRGGHSAYGIIDLIVEFAYLV